MVSARVMISRFASLSPVLGPVLAVRSLLGIPSLSLPHASAHLVHALSFSLSLSLPLPGSHTHTLSLKINKLKNNKSSFWFLSSLSSHRSVLTSQVGQPLLRGHTSVVLGTPAPPASPPRCLRLPFSTSLIVSFLSRRRRSPSPWQS